MAAVLNTRPDLGPLLSWASKSQGVANCAAIVKFCRPGIHAYGSAPSRDLVALMNASLVFEWAGPFNGSFALYSQQKTVAVSQTLHDGCLTQYVANRSHIWQTSGAS